MRPIYKIESPRVNKKFPKDAATKAPGSPRSHSCASPSGTHSSRIDKFTQTTLTTTMSSSNRSMSSSIVHDNTSLLSSIVTTSVSGGGANNNSQRTPKTPPTNFNSLFSFKFETTPFNVSGVDDALNTTTNHTSPNNANVDTTPLFSPSKIFIQQKVHSNVHVPLSERFNYTNMIQGNNANKRSPGYANNKTALLQNEKLKKTSINNYHKIEFKENKKLIHGTFVFCLILKINLI